MTAKDRQVTGSELAGWIGISTAAVQKKCAREGVIPRSATRGRYPLWESIRGYVRHMQDAAANRENPTAVQRTRLLRAQADAVVNKVTKFEEKLVSASSVAETWDEIKSSGRTKLLRLPERIEKRLPGRLTPRDLDAIRKEALLALLPFDADGKPIPAPN